MQFVKSVVAAREIKVQNIRFWKYFDGRQSNKKGLTTAENSLCLSGDIFQGGVKRPGR
jgi:hypothetical protein